MTRIFMTGFENGDYKMFPTHSVAASISVSAVQPRTGTYALYNSANNMVRAPLSGNPVEIYFRIAFYMTGGGNERTIVHFLDSAGAEQLTIDANRSTLALEVRLGGPTGAVLATGSVIAVNTYYCLEGHILVDAVDGVVHLKLDGVDDITFAGNTRATANTDLGFFQLCASGASNAYSMQGYWDDVAFNDTLGTENTSWVGRGGIYPAIANADGTYSEFTPSAGNNWQNVDEVPADDDTTYVESDVLAERDLYATGGIAPLDGLISAVQLCYRAKLADVGIGNLQPLVRHGGADYVYADKAVDSSYRDSQHILELAPDGSAWTVAKVNALEIGQRVG